MARVTFIKSALIAVVIFGGMVATAMAEPAQAVAPRPSAAEFRKLAEPLHLIDNIKATFNQQIRKNPETGRMPAQWQARFAVALDRGTESRREAVTDLIMAKAAKAFTDEEVARLTRICALPAIERYKAGTALAIRTDADQTALGEALQNDPQIRALSKSDRDLMGRLLREIGLSLDAAEHELGYVIEAAYREAGA